MKLTWSDNKVKSETQVNPNNFNFNFGGYDNSDAELKQYAHS